MSIVLTVYVMTYYTWSRYLVERMLPLGLSEVAREQKRSFADHRIIASIRAFVRKRARQIAILFLTASVILLLLVLLTVACMIGKWQSPIPISLNQLVLMGIHVVVFFSIGRKLWRRSVAVDSTALGGEK